MGLGNSSHAIFVGIMDGKIVRRHQAATEGVTKSRTTKTGKLVHEEHFDHLSGFITDVTKKSHETFGDFLVISMVDGEQKFSLEFNIDSGYATAFFKIMPNMDFTKRTSIIPSMKVVDDKKKVTIFINQGEKALKHYFTKDDPKGLPEMKKMIVKNKEVWDNTDQMKFFMKMLEKALPKIHDAARKFSSTPILIPADATVKPEPDNINNDDYMDDLPF